MNVCAQRFLRPQPRIRSSPRPSRKTSPSSWKNLRPKDVLPLLEQGMLRPLQPFVEDLAFLLRRCKKERNREHALGLFAILRKLERVDQGQVYTSIGNELIPILIDVGCIGDAHHVFERVMYRNEWSCYSLISWYVNSRQPKPALEVYDGMQEKHSSPASGHIFVALFKACASSKDLERGTRLHGEVVMMGLLETNLFVGSGVVDMYAKCESLSVARHVFDALPFRDVVAWNILISGYAECGNAEEALRCFEHMQEEEGEDKGVCPSHGTYVCASKACASIGAIEKGREIHSDVERKGWFSAYAVVGNAVVDMYAKCGFPATAECTFARLANKDIVSWNTIIAGYTNAGCSEAALRCYEKMLLAGVIPDAITLLCGLKACGRLGATRMAEEIHGEIESRGLLHRDPFIGSALVDMYAKEAGSLDKARRVLESLPVRNVVSWTTLIAGYTRHGHGEEALECFDRMKSEAIPPNAITFLWSLKACTSMGAIDKGSEIHDELERRGLVEKDLIGNTLVNMYARCGALPKAEQAFDKLRSRDVVSWTALMAGYARAKSCEKVFRIFAAMQGDGVRPNAVTFAVLLGMCSEAGLVRKYQTYLESMSKDYAFVASDHHLTCLAVGLLRIMGELANATAAMPSSPSPLVCQTMLHACRISGSLELGKWAFERAIHSDLNDASANVLMSYIGASR